MTLKHPSLGKILLWWNLSHQFFFGWSFPYLGSLSIGIVVSQEVKSLFSRDPFLIHEVGNLWVPFNFSGLGLPWRSCPLLRGFSLSLWVSSVFGCMASYFVANEAFAVVHVLCLFTWWEVDLVNIHGIGVLWGWASGPCQLGLLDVAVTSSSELPKSYHIAVEFSCFIKLLLPLPSCFLLSFGKRSCSQHDSQLVGDPLLKGISVASPKARCS